MNIPNLMVSTLFVPQMKKAGSILIGCNYQEKIAFGCQMNFGHYHMQMLWVQKL